MGTFTVAMLSTVVLVTLLLLPVSGLPLRYSATIRSFLPSICLKYSDVDKAKKSLDENLKILPFNSLVNEIDAATTSNDLIPTDDLPPDIWCPYLDKIVDGTISGHADFQTSGSEYIDGPTCTVPDVCSDAAIIWRDNKDTPRAKTAVVKNKTKLEHSGLRIVQYCKDGANDRCGASDKVENDETKYTTTNRAYFESWYHDDPKYNKRLGVELELQSKGNNIYQFESPMQTETVMGFNPIGDYFANKGEVLPLEADGAFNQIEAWPTWFTTENRSQWKFSFTTEIHTYFQYRGNEVLSFSGDDDVFVFINDKLAIDLGGLHPRMEASLELSEKANELGLIVNETYRLDIFHAERKTGASNFKLTTTLVGGCNVQQSGSTTFNMLTAIESDYKLGGGASLNPGNIMLTSRETGAQNHPTYVWLKQQQNSGNGFLSNFIFQAGPSSPGFAFVLHNRPEGLRNLPATTGSNLNFRYLTNSVAVVFDFMHEKKISVHFSQDTSTSLNKPGDNTTVVWEDLTRSFNDGKPYKVRIEYLKSPPWLEVYVENSLYLRVENFDLNATTKGNNAYFGFTSTTAEIADNLSISDWSVQSVSINPANSKVAKNIPGEADTTAPADGQSIATAYTFATFDGCENLIEFGGFASFGKTIFVESLPKDAAEGGLYFNNSRTPAILRTGLVDNGDGTYSAQLATTTTANFSVYLCFGADETGCDINVTYQNYTPPTVGGRRALQSALQVPVVSYARESFTAEQASAVGIIPLTAAPTFSPVTLPNTPTANNQNVGITAIIATVVVCLLLVAIILVVVKKRQWRKNKEYIDEGRLFNINKNLTYDKDNEYLVLGKNVLDTKAKVLRVQAQDAPKTTMKTDLEVLRQEKKALQEGMRMTKRQTELSQQEPVNNDMVVEVKKGKKNKKEFRISPPAT